MLNPSIFVNHSFKIFKNYSEHTFAQLINLKYYSTLFLDEKSVVELAIRKLTRRLVNVGPHIMFRPELIYIFDLIVNQMKK